MRPEEITPEALKKRAEVGGPRVCWPWLGHLTEDGYGALDINFHDGTRTTTTAHRAMYEAMYGPLPPGHEIEVHHDCVTPACINPGHLVALTPAEHKEWHGHVAVHQCGTVSRYVKAGCRCDDCREAWRVYGRQHWRRNAAHINARRRERYAAKKAAA